MHISFCTLQLKSNRQLLRHEKTPSLSHTHRNSNAYSCVYLLASGVYKNYGKIDNLHIYYPGNRITGVLKDTDPETTNISVIADLGTDTTGQSFKFGSKELVTDNSPVNIVNSIGVIWG